MGMVYLSCVMGDVLFVLCHGNSVLSWGWCICPVSWGMMYLSCVTLWCSVAGGRPESGLQRSGQLHAEGAPGLLVPAPDLEWL